MENKNTSPGKKGGKWKIVAGALVIVAVVATVVLGAQGGLFQGKMIKNPQAENNPHNAQSDDAIGVVINDVYNDSADSAYTDDAINLAVTDEKEATTYDEKEVITYDEKVYNEVYVGDTSQLSILTTGVTAVAVNQDLSVISAYNDLEKAQADLLVLEGAVNVGSVARAKLEHMGYLAITAKDLGNPAVQEYFAKKLDNLKVGDMDFTQQAYFNEVMRYRNTDSGLFIKKYPAFEKESGEFMFGMGINATDAREAQIGQTFQFAVPAEKWDSAALGKSTKLIMIYANGTVKEGNIVIGLDGMFTATNLGSEAPVGMAFMTREGFESGVSAFDGARMLGSMDANSQQMFFNAVEASANAR